MESTEAEVTNDFYDDLSNYDSNHFFGTNFDPASAILDITEDSDSENYDSDKMSVSYSAGSLTMIRLTEKHQRTADSGKVFDRFIEYFAPDQFWYGTHIITESARERTKWRSYVPLYEFSEGICEQGTQVLKRDIFNQNKIMPGSTEMVDTLPLYFAPLFKMASGDLLLFLDFAESVDYCLMPMTDTVCQVMMEYSSCFRDSERSYVYLETEELHKCLENLDSLIFQLQNCQNDMIIDFKYLYQAKSTLRELTYQPNMRLSSEAVVKLCRLRDFCNHALTLYMNSVLKTMEVLNSLQLTEQKLLSFNHPVELFFAF